MSGIRERDGFCLVRFRLWLLPAAVLPVLVIVLLCLLRPVRHATGVVRMYVDYHLFMARGRIRRDSMGGSEVCV